MLRLEPRDEFPHPPDDAPNFNESVYMNAFDAHARVGGWMRLGNRVNEGHAELSVCLYLPGGRIACSFARPEIASNDAFDAGGLRFATREPFEHVEMSYAGELLLLEDPALLRDPQAMFATAPRVSGAVTFSARGRSPTHGGEPTTPEDEALSLYGPRFARGHFNQHVAVTGEIAVGDERWPLDALGWRDHSWGPRHWQAIWAYRLFLGNCGPDRGFMLLKNSDRAGGSRRLGVLLVDGAYEEITDLDVTTTWSEARDPVAVALGVRTARRNTLIEGRVLTLAPLRNRRAVEGGVLVSRVAEGFTEFRWGDRVGYGMLEYIERLEDGVPVGFPT